VPCSALQCFAVLLVSGVFPGLNSLMMMIAFITIKYLVPLIEGLCAQIYDFKFEIIGGFAFTSFACLFLKSKHVKEKSS